MRSFLIVSIFFFVFFTSVKSQNIGKGNFIIGGDIGFNYEVSNKLNLYSNDNDGESREKNTTISFAPTVGYLLTDWLVIGLEIEYISQNSKIEYDENISYVGPKEMDLKTGLFSPIVRFYVLNGLFAQIDFSYGIAKYKVEYIDSPILPLDATEKTNKTVYGGSLGLGYSFVIKENIIIEPKFNYKKLKYKGDKTDETDNLIFKIGVKFIL
ncbi:autotransporter domain-containing protein [Bacteroidota bacterium]